MIKVMMGIFGLALLATPLFGYAQGANATQPPITKQQSQQINSGKRTTLDLPVRPKKKHTAYPSFCGQNSDGSQLVGIVMGIGGNWDGDNIMPFNIQTDDGTMYNDVLSNTFDEVEGRALLESLMSSMLMQSHITLICTKGKVSATLVGDQPSS